MNVQNANRDFDVKSLPLVELDFSPLEKKLVEHVRNCSNPWCPTCYGQASRIVSDGNYSP